MHVQSQGASRNSLKAHATRISIRVRYIAQSFPRVSSLHKRLGPPNPREALGIDHREDYGVYGFTVVVIIALYRLLFVFALLGRQAEQLVDLESVVGPVRLGRIHRPFEGCYRDKHGLWASSIVT